MEDAMFQVSDGLMANVVPLKPVRRRQKQEVLRTGSEGSFWQKKEREVNNAKAACVNKCESQKKHEHEYIRSRLLVH